jgi:ubiquinone biosynthesis monooxygenase Coq7
MSGRSRPGRLPGGRQRVNNPVAHPFSGTRQMQRPATPLERIISEADHALRVLALPADEPVPAPADAAPLDAPSRALGAALMRVNHAGEVAAQALYRGQALVARQPELRAQLLEAAGEEHAHLGWCEQRVRELGGRTSLLNPLWYAGSFAIGVVAGLAGDGPSLGFLAETERQVVAHLDRHLDRLPDQDQRSRAIVTRMRADEARHSADAEAAGATPLPRPLPLLMALTSRVITTLAHRV